MFRLALVLCGVALATAVPLKVHTEEKSSDDVFHVEVFFEALCGNSRHFIRDQLSPVWNKYKPYMDVEFHAFGQVTVSRSSDGNLEYQCQHGADECAGNMMLKCAKDNIENRVDSIDFTICAMFDNKPATAVKSCAKKLNIPYEKIEECVASGEGHNRLIDVGRVQYSQRPAVNYVPWVTLNHEHTKEGQKEGEYHLERAFCTSNIGRQQKGCAEFNNARRVVRSVDEAENLVDAKQVLDLEQKFLEHANENNDAAAKEEPNSLDASVVKLSGTDEVEKDDNNVVNEINEYKKHEEEKEEDTFAEDEEEDDDAFDEDEEEDDAFDEDEEEDDDAFDEDEEEDDAFDEDEEEDDAFDEDEEEDDAFDEDEEEDDESDVAFDDSWLEDDDKSDAAAVDSWFEDAAYEEELYDEMYDKEYVDEDQEDDDQEDEDEDDEDDDWFEDDADWLGDFDLSKSSLPLWFI